MPSNTYRVLFLCTGNSARSILAEHLLRRLDCRRFEVHSAGSHPKGQVHPMALEVLRDVYGIDASAARSKSWEEYEGTTFDLVVTVCDDARESCPIWPGQPVVAHWGMEDPAAVEGDEEQQRRAFKRATQDLNRRLELFASLPLEKLDRLRLEQHVREIAGSARSETLDALSAKLEGLQTPAARNGLESAFNATPAELGRAAIGAARRRR